MNGKITNQVKSNDSDSGVYEMYINLYNQRIDAIKTYSHKKLVNRWGDNYMDRFNSGEINPTTDDLTLLIPLMDRFNNK